uniref:Peroxisomal membrane protein PEX14-like KPWE domain-containing protein n=1 Tax=Laticauda laticaudata TaxID=8630 RepID=A0A8C5SWA7_LATLA
KVRPKNSPADPPPAPDTSVSFSEMLHLIQTGQDIPGLQKLNISATNGSPTPSQMTQKPKPWEAKAGPSGGAGNLNERFSTLEDIQ